MKLKKLKIFKFKKFKSLTEFEFDEQNGIYGDNEECKSTILEAIVYCLLGTDMRGDNRGIDDFFNKDEMSEFLRVPHGLESKFEEWQEDKKGNKAKLLKDFRDAHDLKADMPEIKVECTIEDRGTEKVIKRRRTLLGTTSVHLNGEQSSNKKVDLPDGGVGNPHFLLSIMVPGYFASLDSETARDIVVNRLPQVDWRKKVANITKDAPDDIQSEINTKKDVHDAIASVITAHKEAKREITSIKSRIETLDESIDSMQNKADDVNAPASDTNIKELISEVSNLTEQIRMLEDFREAYSDVAQYNSTVSDDNATIKSANAAREARTKEIEKLLATPEPTLPVEKHKETWKILMEEQDKIQEGKPQLPEKPKYTEPNIEAVPTLSGIENCPSCDADLKTYIAQEIQQINQRNAKTLQESKKEYEEVVKKWQQKCQAMAKNMATTQELTTKIAELRQLYQQQEQDYNENLREYHRKVGERKDLQNELAMNNLMPLKEEKDIPFLPEAYAEEKELYEFGKLQTRIDNMRKDLEEKQENLQTLQEAQNAIITKQTLEEQIKNSQEQKKKAEVDSKAAKMKVDWFGNIREKIQKLPSEMAEEQLKDIKSVAPNLTFDLYEEAKSSGNLTPAFNIKYEGVDYRVLSTSQAIRMHIELVQLLNSLYETHIPLLIDNGESITTLPSGIAAQQYIVSYVRKGAKLKVYSSGADAAPESSQEPIKEQVEEPEPEVEPNEEMEEEVEKEVVEDPEPNPEPEVEEQSDTVSVWVCPNCESDDFNIIDDDFQCQDCGEQFAAAKAKEIPADTEIKCVACGRKVQAQEIIQETGAPTFNLKKKTFHCGCQSTED